MTSRVLRGSSVILRPLRPNDALTLNEILRDRRVTRMLPPRVRHEGGRHFVRRLLAEQAQGKGIPFVIVPVGTDEVVGQIRLLDVSPSARSGEVGYFLRRRAWGKGFATDALRLICRFGFRTMSLHRVEAKVVAGNLGSRRVLEKVGFRQEGHARRAARLADGWADVWAFGLLRGELRDRMRPAAKKAPRTRARTRPAGGRTRRA
jgi:ribosomal-protein-alanine N-acetyltransferase